MTKWRAERLIRTYFQRWNEVHIRQSVRDRILSAVEEATSMDGHHAAEAIATEAGCLCASIAAQIGGAEGLKAHLENVERDGRSQLPDYQLWSKPELP